MYVSKLDMVQTLPSSLELEYLTNLPSPLLKSCCQINIRIQELLIEYYTAYTIKHSP